MYLTPPALSSPYVHALVLCLVENLFALILSLAESNKKW